MKTILKKIYKKDVSDFYNLLENNLLKDKKMFIVTANPETMMISTTDDRYRKLLLDKSTTIIPDGIGLIKVTKRTDFKIDKRIPGIDVAIELLNLANRYHKRVYLYGASDKVIKRLITKIENEYPNLVIAGFSNGYRKNNNKVCEEIKETNPDIVLVALGVPIQEKFIYKHIGKFDHGIFIGVGGTFDILSGYKKRAPEIFIKFNLEWLYRLMREPRRIKRFIKYNIKFILHYKKYINED